MLKVLGMGILIALFASGCVMLPSVKQDPWLEPEVDMVAIEDSVRETMKEEFQWFLDWMFTYGYLIDPVTLHDGAVTHDPEVKRLLWESLPKSDPL